MSKFKTIFSILIISSFLVLPNKAQAQIPPKAKAFLVMCAYGTVGGALLGFASLAFQNNTRAIAQGASLGLYAGMAFGGYVLASHKNAGQPVDEYPPQDPYQQNPPPPTFGPDPGFPGGQGSPPPEDGGFFGVENRVYEINDFYASNYEQKNGAINSPPIYVPILHMNF